MKRRDFLNSSLLAAAVSIPGIRNAYAVVGTDPTNLFRLNANVQPLPIAS